MIILFIVGLFVLIVGLANLDFIHEIMPRDPEYDIRFDDCPPPPPKGSWQDYLFRGCAAVGAVIVAFVSVYWYMT